MTATIAMSRLKEGRWYVGESWARNVALWDGEFFITLDPLNNQATLTLGYGRYDGHGFTPWRMVR